MPPTPCHRLPLLLAPLALTLGCKKDPVVVPPPAAEDPCGEGTWGALPVDADTLYVASGGGGDGTADSPFATITAAMQAWSPGHWIAVAAGTYVENLVLGPEQDGLRIAGRCSDKVVVDGSGAEDQPTVLVVGGEGDVFELAGLGITGGDRGVVLEGGALSGTGLDLAANRRGAVYAWEPQGEPGSLSFTDTRIADGVPIDGEPFSGSGISLGYGKSLALSDVVVEGNHTFGVAVGDEPAGGGPTAVLERVRFTANLASDGGDGSDYGYALLVQYGATVQASDCVFEDNEGYAVATLDAGSTVELTGGSISGTRSGAQGSGGIGIGVTSSAELDASDTTIADSEAAGIAVDSRGKAVLDGVTISGPIQPDGVSLGLSLSTGTVEATGLVVEAAVGAAVFATGNGASLSLEGCRLAGTVAASGERDGYGLELAGGAQAELVDCELSGNLGAGLRATGAGTSVSLTGGSVSDTVGTELGLGFGLDLEEGAALSAGGIRVQGNLLGGVYIAGSEGETPTTATLADSDILDTLGPADTVGVGLYAGEGAQVVVTGGSIQGGEGYGALSFGADLSLEGTRILDIGEHPGTGVGQCAGALDGGALSLRGATLQGCYLVGVSAGDDSVVQVEDSVIEGILGDADSFGAAIVASGGAHVRVHASILADSVRYGIIAFEEGTTLDLDQVTVSGSAAGGERPVGVAVSLNTGATLQGQDLELLNNRGVGLQLLEASGSVTGLTVSGTALPADKNVAVGIYAGLSELELDDVLVEDTEGPGLISDHATVSCADCSLQDNGFAGAFALGGDLELLRADICGNDGKPALGGGVGVLALDDGEHLLSVQESSICAHAVAGIYVSGSGGFMVQDSTVAASAEAPGSTGPFGNAVVGVAGREPYEDVPGPGPWNGQTGLLISGSSLSGAGHAAVFLSASSATLEGGSWTGNALDLVQQACSGIESPELGGQALQTSLCPTYDKAYDYLTLEYEPEIPGALGR